MNTRSWSHGIFYPVLCAFSDPSAFFVSFPPMVALLLTWTILFLASCQISNWLGVYSKEKPFLSLLGGLALLSLLTNLWAIFFPLNWLLLMVLFLAGIEFYKKGFKVFSTSFIGSLFLPILLLIACLLPSILPVWINDDSAYYLPSIKNYAADGFTAGLAQWNIRFGLASSWHLLSSIFYWEGITPDRVWNFNGLLLFTFSLEFLRKGRILLGLLPVLLFSAPFLNAPSPDLPIILITIYLILEGTELSPKEWALLLLLIIGLKATAIPVLLIGCYPLLRFKKAFLPWILLPTTMGILWIAKNYILTGHLLFPIASEWFATSYALPADFLKAFSNGVLAEIYGLGFSGDDWVNAHLSWTERALGLFQLRTYKITMNVLIILGSIYLALIYRKKRIQNIPIWSLWILASLFLWFVLAPNYRFSLGFGIAALVMASEHFVAFFKRKIVLIPAVTFTFLTMVWMNTQGTNFVRIVSCGTPNELSMQQLLVPVPYPIIEAKKIETEKSFYYRPGDCIYCGNTPVPCLPDTLKSTHEKYGVNPWANP